MKNGQYLCYIKVICSISKLGYEEMTSFMLYKCTKSRKSEGNHPTGTCLQHAHLEIIVMFRAKFGETTSMVFIADA